MTESTRSTVLVVDDNPATRYSTSRVLKSAGFHVLEAATGNDGVAMAEVSPDVVILDVNLPDIDGFQVCRELRTKAETARTPVIHLSATFVTDKYKIQGLESGAGGYLTHPVEPLVLIATVNAFLRARKAEESMRQSEAKFRAIFDQVQDGICLFSEDLKFLEANPAMTNILLRSREALLGCELRTLMSPEGELELPAIVDHLHKVGSWQGMFSLSAANNQFVEIDWRISVHSVPGLWLAIARDAKERVQIETEREHLLESERTARATAERANRLKDDFLATLSHELRTPLSAIVGWTQILKFGSAIDDSDRQQGIEAIERNVKIQTQLIEDLLDVSRITSGKIRLDIQPVDMASVANAALESLMPAIAAKAVEIVYDVAPDAGHVSADPSRLQQVIWNLVNNAIKFSPKGERICIRIRRVGSWEELAVIDNGQGISPEFLPHIFERFRQEDGSTTRSYGGLGLGLAIVKNLVEMHGGSVQAHSVGVDMGAQFIIRLPVTAIAQSEDILPKSRKLQTRVAMPSYLKMGNLAGIKVLIVDDDDDTRTLLKRLLTDCGAEVDTANDVARALKVVVRFQPQILVSDIGMPGQNGYDLIRQLRRMGYDSHRLPAIALTAFARQEDRQRALTAGFQLHLEKPIEPSEFIAAIANLAQIDA
jgi:PAS domain S-box-containing protein